MAKTSGLLELIVFNEIQDCKTSTLATQPVKGKGGTAQSNEILVGLRTNRTFFFKRPWSSFIVAVSTLKL